MNECDVCIRTKNRTSGKKQVDDRVDVPELPEWLYMGLEPLTMGSSVYGRLHHPTRQINSPVQVLVPISPTHERMESMGRLVTG